jgi:Flp pilus assembly protein TadG
MRLTKSTFASLAVVLAVASFTTTALGQNSKVSGDADAVATITQLENASVKADMAGDSSFVEKNYAENFTGGSSWGNWETKQALLADMKDSKNNKTNSEVISDLNVRTYGDTATGEFALILSRWDYIVGPPNPACIECCAVRHRHKAGLTD